MEESIRLENFHLVLIYLCMKVTSDVTHSNEKTKCRLLLNNHISFIIFSSPYCNNQIVRKNTKTESSDTVQQIYGVAAGFEVRRNKTVKTSRRNYRSSYLMSYSKDHLSFNRLRTAQASSTHSQSSHILDAPKECLFISTW